ncbi:MAG TPA: nickel ABC transporter permease, partial [Candidatus Sulfotelmatobacter sp.]|nr:nickel ABC transporter permease [Candidatus Sulfotelmatobacter sp.]
FGVSVIVFLLLRLIPGDPVRLLLPPEATEQMVQETRRQLGFDQPIYTQYVLYLGQLLRGDLGTSIRFQRPVLDLVLERFPATLELTLVSMLVATLVAIPLGIVAAVKRYSRWDAGVMLGSLVGQSVPTFWMGIVLILVFAVQLRVLPTSGRGSWQQLVLPSITLGAYMMALMARLTRSGMLEVLREDYVRTARAKGLPEYGVLVRHAFRNALLPVVTVCGMQVGALLGGAIITEAVFAWPGIGTLTINAIYMRDYPIVQATVLISAAAFVLINFALDLTYQWLDPRIQLT